MLLAGKCCVKCIFDSTQPSCIEAFDTLLMDALLYGPEYKGDERYHIFKHVPTFFAASIFAIFHFQMFTELNTGSAQRIQMGKQELN